MATQADKKRKDPRTTPASTGRTTKDTKDRNTEGNEKDTYDPVGMAGKKAGSVKNIEEQLGAEGGKGSRKAKGKA